MVILEPILGHILHQPRTGPALALIIIHASRKTTYAPKIFGAYVWNAQHSATYWGARKGPKSIRK